MAKLFPWSRQTLLVERTPVRVSRMADLPLEAKAERDSWMRIPIRSVLALPIETGGPVSVIVLQTVHRECDWPDALVTRLRVLGEMLVGALQRQETFVGLREAEEALRASEARLASGADLAGLAFYEVHFTEGITYLDRRFCELCGVPPDQQKGLQPVAFWMEHLHPDDLARVLDARRQLHDGKVDRISIQYRYLHPVRGEEWIHHLGGVVTRAANGRPVVTFGVLRDITERKRAEDEMHDLSRRLIQAHEDERALLARELHDDLTQRLAVLAIEIGRVELSATDREHADKMRMVREELVRLSEDVHSLAYQLHPSVLEELGLAEALRTECERRGRHGRMDVSVNVDALPVPIAKDVALSLFRVAQEALNNVARHSGARAATVTLRQMDGGLLLAVRDSGLGFDPGHPAKTRHLGLAGMRERMQLVNGTLDVESAPGRGTTITAWAPAERVSP
jgi:PAS domain S-box-containing protein